MAGDEILVVLLLRRQEILERSELDILPPTPQPWLAEVTNT